MATIKVEVTYDPKKETLSQALASLLTEKPEHTEITAQMSLFDNPAPTETPTAQTSTEAPQESPAESASEAPDTKPTEEKTISKADVRQRLYRSRRSGRRTAEVQRDFADSEDRQEHDREDQGRD